MVRAAVEIGFIVFLFYANLLMGEFAGTGLAQSRGLLWALCDIFTVQSIEIALLSGVTGYFVVEYLRGNQP